MKSFTFSIITGFFLVNSGFCQTQSSIVKQDKSSIARQTLGNLPAVFRKNAGQWDDNIVCKSVASGANVTFLKDGVSFGFKKRDDDDDVAPEAPGSFTTQPKPEKFEMLVWNVRFKGANKNAVIRSEQDQNSRTNYILGNDPKKWVSNVPDAGLISYDNIYNNIDLQYYSAGQSLKYDYIVHPQGNVSNIVMACEGVNKLSVNKSGEMEVATAWGILKEKEPVAYQLINGNKVPVAVRYALHPGNSYGFEVKGSYNTSYDLIIDPVILEWSTFVGGGGNGNGYIYDIAVDNQGYVYGTGYYNETFPVTPGAYDTSYNANGSCGFGGAFDDVFIIKLNPDATSIVYATYVGGECAERGRGIVVNAAGEAFVTGETKSVNFPTVNPVQSALKGGSYFDIFALRLNSSGSSLIYSTYLGGSYNDWAEKIAINANNEAYLVGASLDLGGVADFPTTAGSFQPVYGGGAWQAEAYVTKLNATGNSLIYSSYLGGSLWDWGYDIVVNQAGEAYVTGRAQAGFPTTAGTYQTSLVGNEDVFVTHISANGSTIISSTLVGGSQVTNGSCACADANAIYVNAAGEAYVTGNVRTSSFPTTPGAYQATFNGGYYGDAFVFKLSADAKSLLYSTYLGGSNLNIGWGIDVNARGEAFIAGYTASNNFPTVNCAIDRTYNGTNDGDFFVAKLNTTGTSLLYSSYFGGNDQDYWEPKIVLNNDLCDQRAVFSGTSHSQNFPTTPGVIQPVKLNTVNDQPVIFKLRPRIYPGFTAPAVDSCNKLITFTDTTSSCGLWDSAFTTHHWIFGDGGTADGVTVTHTYTSLGNYNVKLIVGCPMDSVSKAILINCVAPPPVASFQSITTFCANDCISFENNSTNSSSWVWSFPGGLPPSSTDQNPQNICYPNSGTFDVTLVASNGLATDTMAQINYLTVSSAPPTPNISQSNDTLYCSYDTSYRFYQWYSDTTLINGGTNSYLVISHGGNYNIKVTNQTGCSIAVGILIIAIKNFSSDSNFSLYPNPASDELVISSSRRLKNASLTIYNVLGEQVLEEKTELGAPETISIKNLSRGIYLIAIRDEEGTSIAKFVKE